MRAFRCCSLGISIVLVILALKVVEAACDSTLCINRRLYLTREVLVDSLFSDQEFLKQYAGLASQEISYWGEGDPSSDPSWFKMKIDRQGDSLFATDIFSERGPVPSYHDSLLARIYILKNGRLEKTQTFSRDSSGHRIDGERHRFIYDAYGRPIEDINDFPNASTPKITLQYSSDGTRVDRIQESGPFDGGPIRQTQISTPGHLVKIYREQGSDTVPVSKEEYDFDSKGLVIKSERYGYSNTDSTYSIHYRSTYGYDELGRVKDIWAWNANDGILDANPYTHATITYSNGSVHLSDSGSSPSRQEIRFDCHCNLVMQKTYADRGADSLSLTEFYQANREYQSMVGIRRQAVFATRASSRKFLGADLLGRRFPRPQAQPLFYILR